MSISSILSTGPLSPSQPPLTSTARDRSDGYMSDVSPASVLPSTPSSATRRRGFPSSPPPALPNAPPDSVTSPSPYPHNRPQYAHPRAPPLARHPSSPRKPAHASLPDKRASCSSVSPSSPAPSAQPSPPVPPIVDPPPFDYTLLIRQQPAAARACGYGERDRRVVDPPPIIELKVTDRDTKAPAQDYNGLLAMHCTLLSPDGHDDQTEVAPARPEQPSSRRLMGTLVASAYHAKDEHGAAGMFFVFADLSCRSPGKFRLQFKLLRVDPMSIRPGAKQPCVAAIVSDIFTVYTAKDFPGMRASSELLKSLRRQGLSVGVKKGSEARKGKGKGKAARKEESSDEDDATDDLSDEEQDEPRRGSAGTSSTGDASLGSVSKMAKRKRGAR